MKATDKLMKLLSYFVPDFKKYVPVRIRVNKYGVPQDLINTNRPNRQARRHR